MDAKAATKGLVLALRHAAEPAKLAFRDERTAQAFLRDYGYDVTLQASDMQAIRDHWGFEAIFTTLNVLAETLEDETSGSKLNVIGEMLAAITQLGNMFQTMNMPDPALPSPFNQATFWNEVPRELLDRLTFDGLMHQLPLVGAGLFAIGIMDRATVSPISTGRIPYMRYTVAWERLGDFLADPNGFMRNTYQWGSTPFRHERLLEAVELLFTSLYFAVRREHPLPTLRDEYYDTANPFFPSVRVLKVPLVFQIDDSFNNWAELGFQIMPIPPKGQLGEQPNSFFIAPLVRGAVAAEVLPDTSPVSLTFSGGFETDGGFRLEIRPTGINLASSASATSISAELALWGRPETPYILIGTAQSHRIELEGFRVAIVVRGPITDPEFLFEAGTGSGTPLPRIRFILQASEGDGFIRTILGADPVSLDLAPTITWSSKAGFGINGSAGFTFENPIHKELGPIRLDSIRIAAGADVLGDARIGVGIMAGATLGPLRIVVENIGAKLLLTPAGPGRPAVVGSLALDWRFQPPTGVGLAIDAGVVKGGGFLRFDFDKGEYSGALELTVSNFLSLKAIGLINTKLPGGQPGFSLLVIITAEFKPGFQLGFGFVLNGVGGLVGLNRVMLLDPLAQGVRTGAVNSILFPTNVVENAPKILSDLRTIFPPQQGTFLIGPMAKIAWGTPTLISLSLGVIIEIPGNVVILGRLAAKLPTEEEAVLILQVSFVGALEFDKRRLWFFATLFESRVLSITIEGEMGALMDFSDNPNFLLAVGGFHPRFTVPALPFPSPNRITLPLLNESWARLRAETYFAVTSNTVQIGCRTEAYFGFDAMVVEGHFGYDALLRFSPLYLIVDFAAGFAVKVSGVGMFSVHVRGSLEGPAPWHILGTGRIELPFFPPIPIEVDRTFGERRVEVLLPIAVLPKISAEFEKQENWRATLPATGQFFVSLRELGSEGTLVLHPVGTLQISQRFAPLNLPLDKIGNQKPSDVKKVTVVAQAGLLAVKGPTKEKFAAAQYREMDDAAKLSAQAFEPLESGIELGAAGQPWATGPMAQRKVRYETIILDTAFQRLRLSFFKYWDRLFVHFRAGAAVSRAAVSFANEIRMRPFEDRVAVMDDQHVVAFQADNRAYAAEATFGSYAEAQAYMAETVRLNPSLAEQIHVIPKMEANSGP